MSLGIGTYDLNVGSGQLGTMTDFTIANTNFNILPGVVSTVTRYTSVYNINTSSSSSVTITLPSPADVSVGWRCKFLFYYTTAGTTYIINDHLAANITTYTFYDTTASSYYSGTFLLASSSPLVWIVENDLPDKAIVDMIPTFNSSGAMTMYRQPLLGKFIFTISNPNINVLFSTPALVLFNVAATRYDALYYTAISGGTTITFNVTGNYYLVTQLRLGGTGTTINVQLALRKNGTTILPAMTAISTGFAPYMLKSLVQLNAGDYIELLIGKSVVSAGTSTLTGATLTSTFLG